jgi:hypothetical protein
MNDAIHLYCGDQRGVTLGINGILDDILRRMHGCAPHIGSFSAIRDAEVNEIAIRVTAVTKVLRV